MFSPLYHVTWWRILWNGTFLDIYLTTFSGARKFKNTFKAWGFLFFWKCSKLNLNLEKAKRYWENIFRFSDNCIWKCCYKSSIWKKILVIGSHWVKKQSWYFAYDSKKVFQPELRSQGSINMVKVLSFSFQQCFSPFSMLLVEGSTETRLFYLTTHFRGRKFENTFKLWGSPFFWKSPKLNLNIENAKRNWKNIFRFWDNCI